MTNYSEHAEQAARAELRKRAKSGPVAPVVNLNGSSARDLVDQQRAIADAAYDLITVMCAATPHGRDYQVSANGEYEAARAEHAETIKSAQAIRTRAVDICLAIQKQGR